MIFLHIFEGFHVQGKLGNLKQRIWWENEVKRVFGKKRLKLENTPYKNDYKMSLFIHSVENACFVILPLVIDQLISEYLGVLNNTWLLLIPTFILLIVSHYLIDNQKANEYKITLVADQILHIVVIILFSIVLLDYG